MEVEPHTNGRGVTMLLLMGQVLGVADRTGGRVGEEFTYKEIVLLVGEGAHSRTEHVRVARDYRGVLPNAGDELALEVGIRAYAGRSGPGYNLTAFADASNRVALAAA